jgi:branched-chain amino acid transport system ATP-binding protein
MEDAILKAEDLELSFGALKAVDKVSLSLDPDELFSLVGPNGSGKTCVLNMLSGVYKADSGKITFQGEDITNLPSYKIAAKGIARSFQMVELFSHMTVLDNLLLGCHSQMHDNLFSCGIYWGFAQKTELSFRKWVEEIIDFFEIERYRKQLVVNLPFGVQKLVGVARALAMKPKVVLLDEPSSGMNRQEKEDLARFLLRIRYTLKIPIIWVEHDIKMVSDLADRIAVLHYGRKIAEGKPEEVFRNPEVTKIYTAGTA